MRLADIDSEQLARETVGAAVDRVARIVAALDGGRITVTLAYADGTPLDASRYTVASHAVYSLVRYARDAVPLDASVHEYCVSLIGMADEALDEHGEPDPSTPLGLVVSAALAREAIDAGRAVSTSRLAALASVGTSYVRNLVAAGELRARVVTARQSEVTAADARRWLGARGVAGYRPQNEKSPPPREG